MKYENPIIWNRAERLYRLSMFPGDPHFSDLSEEEQRSYYREVLEQSDIDE